jgi:hypothetical protein
MRSVRGFASRGAVIDKCPPSDRYGTVIHRDAPCFSMTAHRSHDLAQCHFIHRLPCARAPALSSGNVPEVVTQPMENPATGYSCETNQPISITFNPFSSRTKLLLFPKNPPLVPVEIHINPVHTLRQCFFHIAI